MRLCRFVQYEVDSDKSVCFLGVKAGHLSESNNGSATCSRLLRNHVSYSKQPEVD